jgi:hypothetical protein
MKDALRVFRSASREIDAGVKIQEMADNISNAQKVLDGLAGRSLQAGDIDWVVIR